MKEKLLKSLDLDKKNDWEGAHTIVQNLEHPLGCWIHAYLHRKEPDLNNAAYWYSRAGKPMPDYDYEREWHEIHAHISSKDNF